ncbi:MAG: amidohydrolase family protein [Eubacterium sp.]|jgi:N-acyl-D-amino-acid deacylase
MLDILIRSGVYPDFASGELKKMNIGVENGKIVYVGDISPDSKLVLDAAGKVVSPGFIDIHMHEENFDREGKKYVIAQMMLEMGVTTAVGGNCGLQRQSIKEFRRTIDELGGSPVNYIMLAGYNYCRTNAGVGHYDIPTPEQFKQIFSELDGELSEEAFGISFGIKYDPAMDIDEMVKAISLSKEHDHIVSVHARGDGPNGTKSVKEVIELSTRTDKKIQISHLSSCSAMGCMADSLKAIDDAKKNGMRLDFDTYPYNAFSTTMGSTVFEDGCFENWKGKTYSDILITGDPYKGMRCTKEIFEDVRANYPSMYAVAFMMNEDEIAEAICDKNGMIASDSIIQDGNGHPRAAGTFPRVLGKYVREEKKLPLITALEKMTLRPAERLGLEKKGRIEPGADADLTIFDPETIIDKADYTTLRKPEGIKWVLVNGRMAFADEETINDRLGRYIPFSERRG